jgi:hypothetical protein
MKVARLLMAVALVGLLPAPVMAQAASPDSDARLRQERQHRRVIVRPSTPPEEIQRDVDTAADEIEQQQRQRETSRGLTRPAPRRPDLDYDVKSGIQSQRLNDALRGR